MRVQIDLGPVDPPFVTILDDFLDTDRRVVIYMFKERHFGGVLFVRLWPKADIQATW